MSKTEERKEKSEIHMFVVFNIIRNSLIYVYVM